MKPVYDALGREIKVGDLVAMANGAYVSQLFGFVYKLGNKSNAGVAKNQSGGQFIASDGLVVITELMATMQPEAKQKYEDMYKVVEPIFTHERPKSSTAPKHYIMYSPNLQRGWVFSFTNDAEKKSGEDSVRAEISPNVHSNRAGYVCKIRRRFPSGETYSFSLEPFARRKVVTELPFKVIKELGLENYVDKPEGFTHNEFPDQLIYVDKYF